MLQTKCWLGLGQRGYPNEAPTRPPFPNTPEGQVWLYPRFRCRGSDGDGGHLLARVSAKRGVSGVVTVFSRQYSNRHIISHH